MGYLPNHSKIVSIVVVFSNSDGDINFLRIGEYYICKMPRVCACWWHYYCFVWCTLSSRTPGYPPRFLTIRNLWLMSLRDREDSTKTVQSGSLVLSILRARCGPHHGQALELDSLVVALWSQWELYHLLTGYHCSCTPSPRCHRMGWDRNI